MKTLVELCHIFISENAAKYSASCLQELPVTLLTTLSTHLSASQLNRLSHVFSSSGIDTDRIWKLHLKNRWPQLFLRSTPIFGDDRDSFTTDARQQYMERHFHDILQSISFQQEKDPRAYLDMCLYRFSRSHAPNQQRTGHLNPPSSHHSTPSDITPDLFQYAHHARALTLRGVQCRGVLNNSPLMAILCTRVRRLNLHWLIDEYYGSAIALIRLFLEHGVLAELVLFHFKLSKSFMRELFRTCAGLPAERSDEGDGSQESCSQETSTADFMGRVEGTTTNVFDLYDTALLTNMSAKESKTLSDCKECEEKPVACLKGIAVITGPHCAELIKILSDVVPQWPQLQKIALYGASIGNEGFQKVLLRQLQRGQLSHIVMVDCIFSKTRVLSDMLHTVCEQQVQNNQDPVKCLLLCNNVETHSTFVDNLSDNTSAVREPFAGIVNLDISHNLLYDSCVKLLISVIRNDSALRRLKLDGCHMRDGQLLALLTNLSENKALENLSMADINLFSGELQLEEHILKLLQTMSHLSYLNLRSCNLPKTLVCSDKFINAIRKHACLRELNLAGNRLGDAACDLLLSLLDEDSAAMKLKSLDIGFNCIPGESLLTTAHRIHTRYHYRQTPRLSRLLISGNRLANLHSEVIGAFNGLVDDLEADLFDSTTFLADHVSQM